MSLPPIYYSNYSKHIQLMYPPLQVVNYKNYKSYKSYKSYKKKKTWTNIEKISYTSITKLKKLGNNIYLCPFCDIGIIILHHIIYESQMISKNIYNPKCFKILKYLKTVNKLKCKVCKAKSCYKYNCKNITIDKICDLCKIVHIYY